MQESPTPKEMQMTEEEVRAIVATMEQEKLYPCFNELRKRVVEGLPELLGRECPEVIAMFPRIPVTGDLEGVARRLIDGGTIWGPNNYSPLIGSILKGRYFPGPGFNTNEPEHGHLRAKVLEALPVLLGWLKAHEVMTMIPISPLNSGVQPLQPYMWTCGTTVANESLWKMMNNTEKEEDQ
jgi:hypothetical protein